MEIIKKIQFYEKTNYYHFYNHRMDQYKFCRSYGLYKIGEFGIIEYKIIFI